MIVAIDGPAGVGKSTLARRLAEALGLPYINTGLMYRAVTERALRSRTDLDDGRALARLARHIRFELGGPGRVPELLIDGLSAASSLVSPDVEANVSRVARHQEVREVLRRLQRRLGAAGCVMEGRDIGFMVFPEAEVRLVLEAPLEVRSGRRRRERGAAARRVSEAVARRDALDARTTPLDPAPGMRVLHTGGLSPDEVLRQALSLVEESSDRTS